MIPMFKVYMSPLAIKNVARVFESGMIGEGPRVQELTDALKDRFGCNNLLLLNSGTSAITLALRLAGVKHGDEVITTPFTMIATNVAIMAVGGKPVFADIERNSVSLSVNSIFSKIKKRKTKAIIVTLVGGISPDLQHIYDLAQANNIPLIIDAAHGIDTHYKHKHISQWGDYVCFSFQAIKQLTTGDGGALAIKNKKKYELAEKLKWFGMTRKVLKGKTRLEHQMTADVEEWGYKMHMNDINAAIGLANLENLDVITFKQTQNALYYLDRLGGCLPSIQLEDTPSWWSFYIFVPNRKKFMKKMLEKGIETTPMWRRNDEYSCFKKADLPNMTRLQDKIVFIPVGWWLTQKQRAYIVKSVKECL